MKYERHTVNIDISGNSLSSYSTEKQPKYESKIVFLKVLVSGEATLYEYTESGFSKFFFSMNSSEPEQLVYKKYKVLEEGTFKGRIGTNEYYKNQLAGIIKCDGANSRPEYVGYQQKPLIKYFKAYNECKGAAYQTHQRKMSVKETN